MSHDARREAALRVASDHRPLAAIFADLRGEPAAESPAAPPEPTDVTETIDTALRRAVVGLPRSDDADEVAFDLAMAIESALARAADFGARRAYALGVPVTTGPGDSGLDIAPETLAPFAAAVVADGPHAAARLVRETARRLAERAFNAGLAAVTEAADGWVLVQRFGRPYCPAPGCYGHDGRPAEGIPPYADDCICRLEPVRVGS